MANTFLTRNNVSLQLKTEEEYAKLDQGVNTLLNNYYVSLDMDGKAYAKINTSDTIILRPENPANIMLVMQQPNKEGFTKECTPNYATINIRDQHYLIWYTFDKSE